MCIVLCSVSFRHQTESDGFVITTGRCGGPPTLTYMYTWKNNEHSFANCMCEVTTSSPHKCTLTYMEPDTLSKRSSGNKLAYVVLKTLDSHSHVVLIIYIVRLSVITGNI